jgi:hypothetical protein
VDRLEAHSLVRRNRSNEDRRKVELTVTDEAVTLGWDYFGPVLLDIVAAIEQESGAQLDNLERILSGIIAALRPSQRPAGPAPPETEPSKNPEQSI